MVTLAHILVPSPDKMGFHIPPLASIDHLQHVMKGHLTFIGHVNYPVSEGLDRRKGFGWFVTPEQAEEILISGGRVGLGRG